MPRFMVNKCWSRLGHDDFGIYKVLTAEKTSKTNTTVRMKATMRSIKKRRRSRTISSSSFLSRIVQLKFSQLLNYLINSFPCNTINAVCATFSHTAVAIGIQQSAARNDGRRLSFHPFHLANPKPRRESARRVATEGLSSSAMPCWRSTSIVK